MAGQRLMTSGAWATSSRVSSLVIYHICFSGETGPSLTLSRTRNAIKPVLQETLSPFAEVGRERGALLVGGGARHQLQGQLSPASQEVSQHRQDHRTDITLPPTSKLAALKGPLTASQHLLRVSPLPPPRHCRCR